MARSSASSGESRDTIRYYERIGLVPKPIRTPAGYRQYREGVVNRLALIRNAQRFGFSLREISAFLGVRDGGGKPCHDVRAAAGRMLEAMDRQIAELVDTRKRLKSTLKTWDARLSATPAESPGLPARLAQKRSRIPPFTFRPSSGAHASTVHRPSTARDGRISGGLSPRHGRDTQEPGDEHEAETHHSASIPRASASNISMPCCSKAWSSAWSWRRPSTIRLTAGASAQP